VIVGFDRDIQSTEHLLVFLCGSCVFLYGSCTGDRWQGCVVDVRDTLIQALALVVCYPVSLTALENVTLERYVSCR